MRALAIRSQNSLFMFNPGGCGQAEKKGQGKKKSKRALWAGDAVGCMEEGWANI